MIARTTSQSLIALSFAVGLLSAGALVGSANGQAEIPPDTRHANTLTPDQASAISNFVKEHSANLGSDDPLKIRRDRTALLQPLADKDDSTVFRIQFSKSLVPIIQPLATNSNEIVAINALVLAGELATAQAVEILASAAASSKPAIRYESAYALRRTFEALGGMPAPTMRTDQAEEAVKLIGTRLAAETDPLVVDGLVLAGIEASKVASYRDLALTTLARGVSGKAKQQEGTLANEALAQSFLRCGTGIRDALSGSQPGKVNSESLKAAAELGGRLIAYCVKVVETKALPTGEKAAREVHAQIATTGETIVLLASTLQGSQPPQSKNIGERLKQSKVADDASFGEDARTLVGNNGLLTKDPFRFAGNTFLDK